MIDVLIPTVGRPHRVARIVENIRAATPEHHRITFVVEADDTGSIDAVRAAGLEPTINERSRTYAGAINTAYARSSAPFFFTGADDLRFHAGWAGEALQHMDGWVMVVGTNDLLNPYVKAGMHSTHSIVDRRYLDEVGGVVDEGPGSFMPECYSHQFTDTEFIGTAKMRARFRPCFTSIVEHLHAYSGKGEAPDATTVKAVAEASQDSRLYDSRRELWQSLSR